MTDKILVIEDDEINRRFFVSLLQEGGYEVVEAADGQAAIELITEESPSLILTDIFLPKMNGCEVLRTCKEKGLLRGAKIYALTASAGTEVREAGFDGIIIKPVRVREFLRAVGDIFDVLKEEKEANRH
jgi:two-component system cell cycle response regulator DivK